MPVEKETKITRGVEQVVTETKRLAFRVEEFTIRANGPDAGEVFGRTSILDGDEVVGSFYWVVPKEQALPIGAANGLYALLQKTLYGFEQVTSAP